jgi:tRNA(Ile2) C34 agmatinyltransferase TiaS
MKSGKDIEIVLFTTTLYLIRMVKIICKRCRYEWEYSGKSRYATCSRCRSMTKNPDWSWDTQTEEEILNRDIITDGME